MFGGHFGLVQDVSDIGTVEKTGTDSVRFEFYKYPGGQNQYYIYKNTGSTVRTVKINWKLGVWYHIVMTIKNNQLTMEMGPEDSSNPDKFTVDGTFTSTNYVASGLHPYICCYINRCHVVAKHFKKEKL
jgi:hypothetical protein